MSRAQVIECLQARRKHKFINLLYEKITKTQSRTTKPRTSHDQDQSVLRLSLVSTDPKDK